MISSSQKRILSWLSKFSPDLEKSWDVTRDISLPGIADGLGVVRSALNLPLKKLQQSEMVFKRQAHVVGGGTRKRQVFHITDKGREFISKNDPTSVKKKQLGIFIGNRPSTGEIIGRDELISSLIKNIEKSSLLICGLPGIGKTTVVCELTNQLSKQGKTIRWANANEFSDLFDICKQWQLLDPLPKDTVALQDLIYNNTENEILIIDDINSISQRHIGPFEELSEKIVQSSKTRLIFIGREPMNHFPSIDKFQILPLEDQYGAQLLGEGQDLEDRLLISKRLGGHPLALQLYQPEFELPEQSANVQKYVEDTVLSNLGEQEKDSLNLLSMEPIPIISNNSLVSDCIGMFDEQALLRWSSNNLNVEVHHLIRNVRRSFIDTKKQKQIHQKLSEHWQSISRNVQEDMVLLFHQISSGNLNMVELIENHLSSISSNKSNFLAVLIEQALEQKPESSDLHYFAAKVAAHRCELSILKHHIDKVDEKRKLELNLQLAYFEGRTEDAERIFLQSLDDKDPHTVNKLAISAASRRIDDRIFDQKIDDQLILDVKKYLSNIEINKINKEVKSAAIIAITVIKHSLALLESDVSGAEKLSISVGELGLEAESLMLVLRSKQQIFRLKNNEVSIQETIEFIDHAVSLQTNQIYSDSIRLNLVETLIPIDLKLANEQFQLLREPDDSIRSDTYYRYAARWWLCRSYLYPSEKLTCLRESISIHKTAGCSRAAKTLESKLHSLI
ncbi:MAG: hypothetical protein CMA30_00120 [Euryarchaeota archaeon]|nr:hypothetical protein [Euryarchaeota archaeon]